MIFILKHIFDVTLQTIRPKSCCDYFMGGIVKSIFIDQPWRRCLQQYQTFHQSRHFRRLQWTWRWKLPYEATQRSSSIIRAEVPVKLIPKWQLILHFYSIYKLQYILISYNFWMFGEMQSRLITFCRQISEAKCRSNDDISSCWVTLQQNEHCVNEAGSVKIFFTNFLKIILHLGNLLCDRSNTKTLKHLGCKDI